VDVPLRARRARGGSLTQAPQPVELRHGAVSAVESALIAVSATAPANTLATSTAALVAAVGLSAPGALLFCAVPMFGISLAYYYLNTWRSDAGAAYAWVGRSLNPTLGFFAGWALVMAGLLFMVTGSLPVASATLDIVAPKLVNSVAAVTAVGFLWFVAVLGIVLLGIKATANFQKAVTIFQIAGLLAIAAGAIAHGIAHPANPPSATWWLPAGSGGSHAFVAGALVAIFFFWGWDISANLTEETVDRNRAPGIAGIAGLAIILFLFVVTVVATQLALQLAQAGAAAATVIVGLLAVGALPMIYYRRALRSVYYTEPLERAV